MNVISLDSKFPPQAPSLLFRPTPVPQCSPSRISSYPPSLSLFATTVRNASGFLRCTILSLLVDFPWRTSSRSLNRTFQEPHSFHSAICVQFLACRDALPLGLKTALKFLPSPFFGKAQGCHQGRAFFFPSAHASRVPLASLRRNTLFVRVPHLPFEGRRVPVPYPLPSTVALFIPVFFAVVLVIPLRSAGQSKPHPVQKIGSRLVFAKIETCFFFFPSIIYPPFSLPTYTLPLTSNSATVIPSPPPPHFVLFKMSLCFSLLLVRDFRPSVL